MRDIKRIKPFLEEIEKLWEKVPDWRFGQLIINVLKKKKKDPFFYEEEEMLELWKEFFKEYK